MIRNINIKNFKSIKDISIGFSKLNMLFGNNSVGKSSVIQTLLLLRQSYFHKTDLSELWLNGELVEFGGATDILCENTDDEEISFRIRENDEMFLDCQYNVDNGNDILCKKRTVQEISNMTLFNNDFVYLNAQHISPKISYDIRNWNNSKINKFGNNGKFVFPYIFANYKLKVNSVFKDGALIGDDLTSILNFWLNKISTNIELSCEINNDVGEAIVKFYYRSQNGVRSLPRNPLNVGYGITHVLSLIYALITSNENSLIIVENPESHLHPKAQSAVGTLLAYAAMAGAQIICETHSDHIINAIRIAIKESKISNDLVNVSYFTKNENFETNYKTLEIDKNGSFDEYPIGFLDEWDNSLVKLV